MNEIYENGYNLEGRAAMRFDGIRIMRNEIKSNEAGIKIIYIDYLGYEVYDEVKLEFGLISLSDNVVATNGTGIQIDEIMPGHGRLHFLGFCLRIQVGHQYGLFQGR